jgi:hypothetical protein
MFRVTFVDDEPRVLDMLRQRRTQDWAEPVWTGLPIGQRREPKPEVVK